MTAATTEASRDERRFLSTLSGPSLGALLLTVIVFLVGAWLYRWMSDDGFIHLRIVDQVTAGNGPVFNAGERVEASTSPAWTWLLVVLDLLVPASLEWIAVVTGILLSALGLWLAMIASARLVTRESVGKAVVPAGGLVLAVLPAMWLNASMGLENGLVFAWIGGVAWCMCRWATGDEPFGWGDAVLIGFGTLIRPELALMTVGLLVIVGVAERRAASVRRLLGIAGAALALPIAYEVFRAGYYASLVPNSAIAKEASMSYWSSGWDYLVATVVPYALWFPLVVLGLTAVWHLMERRRDQRDDSDEQKSRGSLGQRTSMVSIAFPVIGALMALFIVRVGGDFYPARLLLPALFTVLVPFAVLTWERQNAIALLLIPWALVSAFWIRPEPVPTVWDGTLNPIGIEDYESMIGGLPPSWIDGPGAYVKAAPLDDPSPTLPETTVASYGVGSIGYALGPDVYLLDKLGLGDSFTSHLELVERGPLVGHEKPLPAPWVAARLTEPDAELSEDDFSDEVSFFPQIDDPDGRSFEDRVGDARAALQCDPITDLRDAISSPLTIGRFFSNMVNAPRFSRLRIPAEPAEAESEFCQRQ